MKKKGFTIVEMMIAMAILLIVVSGVGTAVEVSSSIYAKNSYDLKNVEYTNKILQYFKGLQLSGIDTIYKNSSSTSSNTQLFYLYFNNDDTNDITSKSLNTVLTSQTSVPVVPSTTNTSDYSGCNNSKLPN